MPFWTKFLLVKLDRWFGLHIVDVIQNKSKEVNDKLKNILQNELKGWNFIFTIDEILRYFNWYSVLNVYMDERLTSRVHFRCPRHPLSRLTPYRSLIMSTPLTWRKRVSWKSSVLIGCVLTPDVVLPWRSRTCTYWMNWEATPAKLQVDSLFIISATPQHDNRHEFSV